MASLSDQVKALVRRVVRWAVIESSGSDSGAFPVQQVSYLNRAGLSVAWFPYGFHAVAESDDQALLLTISAQADARVHLPGSPGKRIRLKPGEVAVYHPKTKSVLHFATDGSVLLEAKSIATVKGATIVNVEAPLINAIGNLALTGNLVVGGTLNVTGPVTFASEEVTSNGQYIGGAHEHNRVGTGDDFTEGPVDNRP